MIFCRLFCREFVGFRSLFISHCLLRIWGNSIFVFTEIHRQKKIDKNLIV